MKKLRKKLNLQRETVVNLGLASGGVLDLEYGAEPRPTDNLGTTNPPSQPIIKIRFP